MSNNIEEIIKKNYKIETPAELEQNMRSDLNQLRMKINKNQRAKSLNIFNFIRINYKYAIGFATVLIIAAVLIFGTNGKEVYAKNLYRNVVIQLNNFKSISFVFSLYTWELDIKYVEDHYLSFKAASGFESYHDFKKGEEIILINFLKNYLIRPKSKSEFDDWFLLDDLKNLSQEADEELGSKTFVGIECSGFRTYKQDKKVKVDLWISQAEKNLTYAEINLGGEVTFKLSDIKIDQLDQSEIDSLTIPKDYKPLPKELLDKYSSWIENHEALVNPQRFKIKFEEN